jgi:8-oxo-dGTP diphosphatase
MLLLRHASAGERLPSKREDRARRLDAQGRREARRLAETLARHEITRIVSSPYARCVESVQPIAAALGLEIETRDELVAEAPRRRAAGLLATLPGSALVCTHREVFERLFDGAVTCEKGGTWIVERRDGPLGAGGLPDGARPQAPEAAHRPRLACLPLRDRTATRAAHAAPTALPTVTATSTPTTARRRSCSSTTCTCSSRG